MEKILLIGTGGLSGEIVDFIDRYQLYEIIGFVVNREYLREKTHLGKPIFPLENVEDYVSIRQAKVFSTISWYNYLNKARKEKYEEFKEKGYMFANLISPHAMIYTADMGEGNWIHDFAHIGYETRIGNNNIIRMNTTISHYSVLGSHNVMVSGSRIGGHTICGDRNFFGINSTVFNRVVIGNLCVIGGGAVVREDLADCTLCAAAKSFQKQYEEREIERFISPQHVRRSVNSFEEKKTTRNM